MLERWIRAMAGTFVIVTIGLSQLVSASWLLATLFVGLNLLQSAFTGFCPAEAGLRRLGVGRPRRTTAAPHDGRARVTERVTSAGTSGSPCPE
jgi:hypothetical protein